jgi:hypothetical protein
MPSTRRDFLFYSTSAATLYASTRPQPGTAAELNGLEIARQHNISRDHAMLNFSEGMLPCNGDIGVCITSNCRNQQATGVVKA